jgi:glycine/D-amino acid oxidase-like deaminating enzyme
MSSTSHNYDAVVIGGGFYGTVIAIYLAKQRGLKRLLLVERENALLKRASYNNQARVHNGYHYPRSFTTAYRSRINFPKFLRDWPQTVRKDFTSLYAIARRNSKVTARQFEHFCRDIGAKLQPAPEALRGLFNMRLIEDVFLVEEYAFDSGLLAAWAADELAAAQVEVRLGTHAVAIHAKENDTLEVVLISDSAEQVPVRCKQVLNCTYSGINQLQGDFPGTRLSLKQEITEMALMKAPEELKDLGVTVMDGPFFSFMPFPARGLHSLSHVRYTPHAHWSDRSDLDPYGQLDQYGFSTRVDRMVRDAGRYLPALLDSRHVESLLEVKTVLVKNEGDDGRPILFEKHSALPGCISVLGGKIDNIYDVLEKLEAEPLVGLDGRKGFNG